MMLDDRARLNEGCCAKWREINLGDNDVDAAWIATKERQTRTIDADHVVMPLPRSWWRLLGRAMCSCSPTQGRQPAELAEWTRQVKARLGVALRLAKNFRTMLGELGPPPHVGVAALAARARRRHDECYRLLIDAKAPIGPKFSSRPSSRSG
jgi:hypothetical protein